MALDGIGQNVTVTGLGIVVADEKGRTVAAAAEPEQTEAVEVDQAAVVKSLAGSCLAGEA